MLEELQKVVGELYELYGATTQVVKLSQILDEFVLEEQENEGECKMNKKQENEMLKIALKQAKHEYDLLETYYQLAKNYIDELEEELDELASENVDTANWNKQLESANNIALDKLSEASKKILELKRENEQLQVKNAILQGENNNIKNRLRILTGREEW